MATASDRDAKRDIISDLPSIVIDRILELMPLEDAVRTSALARNWRYNWTTISKFKFDTDFFRYLYERSVIDPNISSIITKILLLHEGRISSFSLHIPDQDEALKGDIDIWILFLSRKDIKEFTLTNPYFFANSVYKLPSHLYSCLNLKRLELIGCVFIPPFPIRGLPKLNDLVLDRVTFEKEPLECFISKCPVLDKIALKLCRGPDKLYICSSSLRELLVEFGKPDFVCINAESLEILNLARVSWMVQNPENGVSSLIKGLGGLPKIEDLCLGGDTLKFLAAGGTPRRLPTPLKFLQKVTFPHLDFGEPAEILSALCLIRSAPQLREIDILDFSNTTGPVSTIVSTAVEEECVMRSLQVVRLYSIKGERIELKFIKSILASSPSLKFMFLIRDESVDEKLSFLISKKLSRSRRASATVEIIHSWSVGAVF